MGQSESQRPVTQKDIASKLGITHAAVSMALRNNPRIPPATRKRVQAAAAEMGYQLNPMAVGLASFKKVSGVRPVQAGLAWPTAWKDLRKFKEFDRYWDGAAACAEKFGFRLEEFEMGPQFTAARLEKVLLTRGIQGILIPPLGPSSIDWQGFDWSKFCVVRLGRRDDEPRCHFVTSAQVYNTLVAFKQVRAKGYRRIGFVGGRYPSTIFGAGYLWAQQQWLEDAHLPPCYAADIHGPEQLGILSVWLKENQPDAIVSEMPDLPAMLKRLGYRVPDDIALAGTTVLDTHIDAGIYQNPEEIGRVATLMLISMIHDNDRGIPDICREMLVQGKWVDGSSLPERK